MSEVSSPGQVGHLPRYGDMAVAHAARLPTGWVVWYRRTGCVASETNIVLARRLVRSMGVEWTHLDGPEVDE